MEAGTHASEAPVWPFGPLRDGMEWWRRMIAAMQPQLAPDTLDQPILPGWTFGNSIIVNENNSSSPETERQIVAQLSYGRQLGVLTDAVLALAAQRPADAPQAQALDDLAALAQGIAGIKQQALQLRTQRLVAELAALKQGHAQAFDQVMAAAQALPPADQRPPLTSSEAPVT